MPRELSIVRAILERAHTLPGLLMRKRHGNIYSTKGDPDLSGCFWGRHVECEVKQPGEAPTPLQAKRLQEWKNAGAITFWVTSAADFFDELRLAAPYCAACGSSDIEVRHGQAATGVTASDGGSETRPWEAIYCRTCGASEEL